MLCWSSRIPIVIVILYSLAGCQGAGSRPSLLTQGTGKVPPPATGSYGTADKGYFNNPGGSGTTGSGFSAPIGNGTGIGSPGGGVGTSGSSGTGGTGGTGGSRPGLNSRSELDRSNNSRQRFASNNADSNPAAASEWRPVGSRNLPPTPSVSTASYQREEAASEGPSGAARSRLMDRLRGMPANDATGSSSRSEPVSPASTKDDSSDRRPLRPSRMEDEPETEPDRPSLAPRPNSKLRWGSPGG
jgi:hypothetical protein